MVVDNSPFMFERKESLTDKKNLYLEPSQVSPYSADNGYKMSRYSSSYKNYN
ncbi:hypothetical protein HN747_01640 [archaeon]|jgi:hypothetical protein|nr:hypothetical protein [archaeon]